MSAMRLGPGQIVTATFSDGEDPVMQDCLDNGCECGCHDEAPLPAGTYVTVRLDDPDARVGIGRVNVEHTP